MIQGTRIIINYRVLRTLHELCIHYSSSPASWRYPRGNPMGLNLHRCCCREQWGLNDLLFHGSPPPIYINFASEVFRSAVRPYKLGEISSSRMNDYSVTILLHVSTCTVPAASSVVCSSCNFHLHFRRWGQCCRFHIYQHSSPWLSWLQKQSTHHRISAPGTSTLADPVALHLFLGSCFATLSVHSFFEALPALCGVLCHRAHPRPQRACWKCWISL